MFIKLADENCILLAPIFSRSATSLNMCLALAWASSKFSRSQWYGRAVPSWVVICTSAPCWQLSFTKDNDLVLLGRQAKPAIAAFPVSPEVAVKMTILFSKPCFFSCCCHKVRSKAMSLKAMVETVKRFQVVLISSSLDKRSNINCCHEHEKYSSPTLFCCKVVQS